MYRSVTKHESSSLSSRIMWCVMMCGVVSAKILPRDDTSEYQSEIDDQKDTSIADILDQQQICMAGGGHL